MRKTNYLRSSLMIFLFCFGLISLWGQQTWTKIANHTDVTETDTYMIVDVSSSRALTSEKGTDAAPTAVAVTITNNGTTITGDIDVNLQWTFKKSGNNYTIHPKSNSAIYLYTTNTNNGVRVGTSTSNDHYQWKLGITGNGGNFKGFQNPLVPTSTGRYMGVYNSQDWRTYTSIHDNIKETKIEIFKLEVATGPKLEVSTESISGLGYEEGSSTSTIKSFEISGENMDGSEDVTVSLLLAEDFEISLSENGTYSSGDITLSDYDGTATLVYVRLKTGLPISTYEDLITVSGYEKEAEIEVFGEVIPAPTEPVVIEDHLDGTVGVAFSYQIQATENPTSYSISSEELPAGLSLNTTTGLISGTPTAAGEYIFGVIASNHIGDSEEAIFTMDIAKGTQTATFENITGFIGDPSITLPLNTTQGVALEYISDNESIAVVNGNTLELVGKGTTTIYVGNDGDDNYNPFTSSFEVVVKDPNDIPCFEEDFSSITNGNTTTTGGSSALWSGNTNFPSGAQNMSQAYQAGGAVRIGTGSAIGFITSKALEHVGNVTVSFDVKGWTTVEGNIKVVYGGQEKTVTYSAKMADPFEPISLEFTGIEAGSKLRIEASRRAFIDNVSVCLSAPASTTATWTADGEWLNGKEPSITDDVIIEGDLFVSDYQSFEAKSLTVNGSLYVDAGYSITVDGAITNNAGASNFLVESGANLIQTANYTDNNIGEITVYRNSEPMVRNDMTIWSSPVTGQSIRDFSVGTLYNRFWSYDEANSTYAQLFSDDSQDMEFAEGAGIAIRVRNTLPTGEIEVKEGTFVGVPNNGTVRVPVTVNGEGYNILGNPYPSNISVSDENNGFLAVNPDVEAIYFWTHQYKINTPEYANNYATFTLAGGNLGDLDEISAGQGFFVKVSNAGEIEFNNAMRVDNATPFYRNNVERHRMWISIANEEQKLDQILVAYMSGASNDFDKQIDAKTMQNGDVVLYNLIGEDKFAVQGRALPFVNTDVVALGLEVGTAGTYTLSLENMDGLFAEGQEIFIKDNLTEVKHKLSESPYTFETEAGVFNQRFEIVYQEDETMGGVDLTSNKVQIYQNGNQIVVSSKSEKILSVELYDLQGRNIHRATKVGANEYQFNTAAKGVLVVKVQTQNGEVTTKKLVNK